MLSNNDKVSINQVVILLILDLFGTGSLIIPRLVVEEAKQDGWILIIGGTLIAMVYGYIVTKLASMFPNDTIVEFSEKITNRFIAVIISIVLFIKLIVTGAFELRIFGELIKQTLLTKTPIEIIMISMLLVCAYLARKGYECRARIGEFLIFLVFIPIAIVFAFGASEIEFSNLVPIFISDPSKWIKGSYFQSFNFSALELMMIATVFITKPEKTTKAVWYSISIVGVLNLVIFFVTLGNFGILQTQNHIWPVITMMQVIDIPMALVERQDALMMSFWIFAIFIYINGILFFSSMLLERINKFNINRHLILPLLPIIYVAALIPNNIVETYDWMMKLYKVVGITFLIPVPLILLIIAKLRKLGEDKIES